jgi:hypothetical protein
MLRTKWLIPVSVIILMVFMVSGLAACGGAQPTATAPAPTGGATTPAAAPFTAKLGGTFALTGAYAEDCAAILAGFQDYAKYVNDNHVMAPWYTDRKIPNNITVDVLWADDELKADKCLTIYEDFKTKGLLVERVSGSTQGLALLQKLTEDKIGSTSQAAGPWLLTAYQTIFPNYPIYPDAGAAAADWFMKNWKDTTKKPRVAYLTSDNPMGKGIDTPELKAYLEKAGFEFAGSQYIPLVLTSPPTTQLAWLKENKVNLTLGVLINPNAQPMIKEAVRLGMGPFLDYKITFVSATPSHLQVFVPAMGELGNGYVVSGGYAAWDAPIEGMKWMTELQNKYRPDKKVTHVMYVDGVIEAMTQLEAMRLASASVPWDKMKSADVLEKGFYQIKGLSTGGIASSPLTLGPNNTQGVTECRVQQVVGGKIVDQGSFPLRKLYPTPK